MRTFFIIVAFLTATTNLRASEIQDGNFTNIDLIKSFCSIQDAWVPQGEVLPDQPLLRISSQLYCCYYDKGIDYVEIISLTPEMMECELQQLDAISQGQIKEIHGWQKLNRYFDESQRIQSTLLPRTLLLWPLSADKDQIKSERFFGFFDVLFWNRLMMFDLTVDSLMTLRQQTNAPLETLQSLKQAVGKALQHKGTGRFFTDVTDFTRHPANQLFIKTVRESPFLELVDRYNKGCRVDLNQIN